MLIVTKINQSICHTYNYFQKTCIKVIIVAKIKLTIVLLVNPSPIKILAQTANVNIPAAKPNNLQGHIKQSNAIKPADIEGSQLTDNQEKIIDKEFINPKNLNKDDHINK